MSIELTAALLTGAGMSCSIASAVVGFYSLRWGWRRYWKIKSWIERRRRMWP